jgi:hypothetical protein
MHLENGAAASMAWHGMVWHASHAHSYTQFLSTPCLQLVLSRLCLAGVLGQNHRRTFGRTLPAVARCTDLDADRYWQWSGAGIYRVARRDGSTDSFCRDLAGSP